MRGIGGRRSGLWMALAGVAGLLAAVLTLRASAQPDTGGTILVARAPLPPGLLIRGDIAGEALAERAVPSSLRLPGVLTDPAQAAGRRIVTRIGAGEPLTQAAFGGAPDSGPAPLAPGERAVAVPLSSAAGAAAGLVPGARVDVVASTGEGVAGRTALVVADAEVLAVAEDPSADGIAASGSAWLRTSAAQALRITAALNFAREVRLLARPGAETGPAAGPRSVDAP
jgi:pilus assembly protein CpaB